MISELNMLLGTALLLGIGHTAVGIDHSLPFVLIGRARGWSLKRTLLITFFCGLGHVLSSVVIGLLGVGLVIALSSLSWFEQSRGHWAAWMLIGLGAAYAVVSFWRMRHGKAHRHLHVHVDGTCHSHAHAHERVGNGTADGSVVHEHGHQSSVNQMHVIGEKFGSSPSNRSLPVALFVVFLVGPCEALLPLMTAPALNGDPFASALVATVFGAATLLTMLALVTVGYVGLRASWTQRLEPHLNWLAGVAIALSGLGVQMLGV